jgi:hypothetical protein
MLCKLVRLVEVGGGDRSTFHQHLDFVLTIIQSVSGNKINDND